MFDKYTDMQSAKAPFDIILDVKGNDFQGDYIAGQAIRKKRNDLKKCGKWYWATIDGKTTHRFNKEIDGWKFPENNNPL